MATLEQIRHTLAHLLATAAKEFDPGVQLGIGPVTDDGFYYDFKFSKAPTPDDLKSLEAAMRKLVNKKLPMTGREIDQAEGAKLFAGEPFKLELLNEYAGEGKTLTAYTVGDFTDLCKGGHVENTGEIDAGGFTLTRVAGAYWRGDEKNPQLTRIYGMAFESKEALKAHETQLEEAKKRDHRKLGKELGLFVFSDLVGPGLPLWTPRGTMIRELLNDYVWELRKARGYQKVTIPHITKKSLYETSGHWAKYAEDLFKIDTREGHLYAMKPMNCPHHTQIFNSSPHSYRDMPERYAETTMVYRDEQSGELSGLQRVLSITQDDAHVFCREDQIAEEAGKVWDIISAFYGVFGFTLTPRFSRRDPKTPEKYLGTDEGWEKAEGALKKLMEERKAEWIDGPGEAAFYGPKIDFMAKDSIGRVWQVATIQIDYNQPKNFGLVFTNNKGEKEQVVMIHAAIMGSIERFMSIIIEHTAANFPVWLSPTQVAIVPVSEKHEDAARELCEKLKASDIRTTLDASDNSLGKRIRAAKEMKVPYVIVLGDKEVESKTLTIEKRDGSKLEGLSVDTFLKQLESEVRGRILN